jgi:FtsP/CotA-like multicopper oxidase with cupredoxin domain
VIHCHILIHEDRGMMQLVQVVSDKPPYTHE